MTKCISARLDNGLESLVRVTNILRRKEFKIKDIKMTSSTEDCHSELVLTIYENEKLGIKQAINQMKKVHDVCDIKEVN
ncbi:ACT domain-containing protein [Clostridiaceae bacterium M8S5]|nr:ACT domain-containing protein [Clostridiaceae bacterium M8S5]